VRSERHGYASRIESESSHAYYLRDLGYFLREDAEQAARAARRTDATEFEQGIRMAYYSVISLMQAQAETFDLPMADLAFEGLDPERDILAGVPVTSAPRDRRLMAAEDALFRDYERRGRARWWTVRRYIRAFKRSPDT
jgi:hypothetical protein